MKYISTKPEITKEMLSGMQGVIPSTLSTASKDGIPNVTFISQMFYVDSRHVALSFQFMNKTWRNLQENPVATAIITSPDTFSMWKVKLRYLEIQTEGPIFEQMEMQLMAITSMMKIKIDFVIKAALICKVESVEVIYEGE
ncbi:pyridoxamine 5'-phosphate oxidase family protein [Rhodocytophaga rosea]|uniref:Pyridoxamine 5'-phosphate oxidase family protein n=1 Tax=Rhodocytophaga rosea TaxID=2704465 RepID=A0A6C0GLF0_9BACT|nr:pyridoxamine 5'-phosphate oxidase family protein [Rhodocytophaga rosea]QHT68644.1 pyridoxamine 5'-phosphate oxidase family protein [Rhodocytophaga rosea]